MKPSTEFLFVIIFGALIPAFVMHYLGFLAGAAYLMIILVYAKLKSSEQ